MFGNCWSLTSIVVNSGNTVYRSEGNCLIQIADNALIAGCSASVIPNGVISINDLAFYGCLSLTNITIPNSVMSIGAGAFYDSISLTGITIPDSVTSIGDNAFYGCSSLITVTFEGANTEFNSIYTFPGVNSYSGSMLQAYQLGGIGTYNRQGSNSYTWTWTKE